MASSEHEEEYKEEQCVGWIDAKDIPQLKGKVVTIMGRNITKHPNEEAKFLFEDGTGTKFHVYVAAPDFKGYNYGTVVEVTGRVISKHIILQTQYTDWGPQARIDIWSRLIKLTRQFPGLF